MVKSIVTIALQNRALVVLLSLILLVGGLLAFRQLPVEAYPNPVPPMVELIVQPPGWSAEEVERYVTIPLEIGLSGMPGLDHIRSQSLYGLADVKCYFKWSTRYLDARQEVVNRLQFIHLPSNLEAALSPANPIGEVYRFNLRGKGYSNRELKTAADWILVRQFKQVPGVADLVTYGGETKEYHVEVDPYRLRARGIGLVQLQQALTNANQNVGGQRLTLGEQAYTIRGIGLFRDVRDIEAVVVAAVKGVPVRVRDVATVSVGSAPRLGIVGRDGDDDVVQGTIIMRYGGETRSTLRGIYERIDYINQNNILPPGMRIEPYYDRSTLIGITTHTVLENLLIGMVLVTLVLLAFLGSVKAALITALNIPFALLVAFIGMVGTGTPANLISLGAVDFGIVVDSTVIMVENIYRHLGKHGFGTIFDRIRSAAAEVGQPLTFATLIIAVAFLPLFTMTGVSGVIFSPMAYTYAFSIGGAIVLAMTLTPVLISRAVPATTEERETWAMRWLRRVYRPAFDFAMRHARWGLLPPLAVVVLCVVLFPLLGSEYMPKLEEGNFWIRATFPMSISLEESARHVGKIRKLVKDIPEVDTAVSQLGRPDDGTDVSGFQNIEIFAPLRPSSEWRRGVTKEKLTEELAKRFQEAFPGVVFNFSQYLSDNVEEALSGVKGENSIKVKGPDIFQNEATADTIVEVAKGVEGVKDLGALMTVGQPSIKIMADRDQCARYGLNTGDVAAVIAAAIGGQPVTQVFEGEKSFALTVRWQAPYRSSVSAIRSITVNAPDGTAVPLGQIATIAEETGPSVIYREDGSRYSPVKFSVRGRDLGSTVAEAQQKIKQKVRLGPAARLEWAGQMNELKEAMGRLAVIIPLTLLLVALLVYAGVKTWLDTAVVLVSIPVACLGGIFALLVSGEPFSASAAMGFVSIFGIAVQDAILVVTYAQRKWEQGLSLDDGARAAAEQQFRAGLMATLTATLGLLPAAVSNGIGAQAQKPLAIVVIGGSLALAILTRLIQPPLLVSVHRLARKMRRRAFVDRAREGQAA